jgi:hypothetical protein
MAATSKHAARFLRLGGPTEFRKQVIAMIEKLTTEAQAYKLLVEEDIAEIEFLLTNPYSEAFLARMDEEKHANWQTWRVRDQVKDFAKGLLKASIYRTNYNPPRSPIKIAFHNSDLIWNIGIAEDSLVIVHAYYESYTGHSKDIEEKRFLYGQSDRIAEAFQSYYQSVKNHIDTDVVHEEGELDKIGIWPSVFKANAILSPLYLMDEEAHKSNNDAQQPDSKHLNVIPIDCAVPCTWVEKACESSFGQLAEEAWLSLPAKIITGRYFNPVRLCRKGERKSPFYAKKTLCMHAIEGITVTEFIWHLHRIAKLNPALIPKLTVVSGALTYQAFRALEEFRRTSKKNSTLNVHLEPYPWRQQLRNAVHEAGRFIVDNKQELLRYEKGAEDLGAALEEYLTCPFRDAHLKNRMIQIDRKIEDNNYQAFQSWLIDSSDEKIFNHLRQTTYDIDFETCFWKVSEWDDPFHIIWSNNFGYENPLLLVEHIDDLAVWLKPAAIDYKNQGLWMTLLCRSLREYCRRLWYDHVMPNTYQRRYSKENRDLFLEFARAAETKVNGFTEVKQYIDKCFRLGDSIWNYPKNKYAEEVVKAAYPTYLDSPKIDSGYDFKISALGREVVEHMSQFPKKSPVIHVTTQNITGTVQNIGGNNYGNITSVQGENNIVNVSQEIKDAFQKAYEKVKHADLTSQEKESITVQLKDLEEELKKEDKAEVGRIQRINKWLKDNAGWVAPIITDIVKKVLDKACGL